MISTESRNASGSYNDLIARALSDPLVMPLWEKSSEAERALSAVLYEQMLRSRVATNATSGLSAGATGYLFDWVGLVSTSPLGGWVGGIIKVLDEAIEADRINTDYHDLFTNPFPAKVPESWFAELAGYRDGGEELNLGFFDED